MTEKQFDDLTNLYLDHEIGRHELRDLKEAIRHNVLRRRKFERACEIHQAARKALAAPPGATAATREAGEGFGTGASLLSVARTPSAAAPEPPRPRGARPAGSSSAKQKQSQAHRNASVVTLAERQLHKGAASAVDLRKISLASRRGAPSVGGRRHIFSFFDSPAGIMIGGLLMALGAVGLFFFIKFTTPDENDDGTIKNPALHQSDVVIDPKVLKELAADQKDQRPANDATHARLYQAALTGQSATNTPLTNEFASPASTAASPTSSSSALSAPPVALTLANPDANAGNLTAPMLPGAPGADALTPSQDAWVQLSLPAQLPPASSLDDKNPPANQTTMPVMLP